LTATGTAQCTCSSWHTCKPHANITYAHTATPSRSLHRPATRWHCCMSVARRLTSSGAHAHGVETSCRHVHTNSHLRQYIVIHLHLGTGPQPSSSQCPTAAAFIAGTHLNIASWSMLPTQPDINLLAMHTIHTGSSSSSSLTYPPRHPKRTRC
jgi:hypothetical protein